MVLNIKLPVLALMAGTCLAVTFPQHIERLEPYVARSLPQTLQQFLLRSQQQQQEPQPEIHRRNVAYYTVPPTTLTTGTTTTTQSLTTSEAPYVEPQTELQQRQLPDEPDFQQITRASIDPTLRRQNQFLDLPDTKKPIPQLKSVHMKPTQQPKTKLTKKEKKDAIDSSNLAYEEPVHQASFAEHHPSQAKFEERDFQTAGHDSGSLFSGAASSVYESPAHHSPAPHFEHTPAPQYEHSPAPHFEHSPAPQYEHSPAPHFEHSPAPHFEYSPAPQYEHSPAPHFEHSPAPHFEHSPAPQYEHSPAPHFEHSPAPHFEHSPAPHFEHSSAPHFDLSPTTHFEHSPSPHFDLSPSAHASASHSAHFSSAPSPHFSSGGLNHLSGGYKPEPNYYTPAKYHFKYAVRDQYGGNDFGHQEARSGDDTKGAYYVQLPDGRRQIVNYYVNKGSGFVANVKYDGKAHHPPPKKYQGPHAAHGGLGGLGRSQAFLHGGAGSSINHIPGGASKFDVHHSHGLDIHGSSPYSSGGLGASLHSLH